MPPNDIYSMGFGKNLTRNRGSIQSPVVYDYMEAATAPGAIQSGGDMNFKSISLGGFSRMIGPGDDIQAAIDGVSKNGLGGVVLLQPGMYVLTGDLFLRDGVSLIGAGIGKTIIDASAYQIRGEGGQIDGFTGTMTEGSTAVTATAGGNFTVAKEGDYVSNNIVFYEIASVTDDSNLTLKNAYPANTDTAVGLALVRLIRNVTVSDLEIWNGSASTDEGVLHFNWAMNIRIRNVRSYMQSGTNAGAGIRINRTFIASVENCVTEYAVGWGLVMFSSGQISVRETYFQGNARNGVMVTGCFGNIMLVLCEARGNTQSGIFIEDSETIRCVGCSSFENDLSGFSLDTVNESALTGCVGNNNATNGLAMVSCSVNSIVGCEFAGNTTTGINMDSGCTSNVFAAIVFERGDLEVTHVIDNGNGNNFAATGENDLNDQKSFFQARNTSGSTLRQGMVVVFAPTTAGTDVTLTTTVANPRVFGVFDDVSVANNSYGSIQNQGKSTRVWADSAGGSIAVGSWLCTFSVSGYASVATGTGTMVFGMALEALNTGTAQIDAILFTPHMI